MKELTIKLVEEYDIEVIKISLKEALKENNEERYIKTIIINNLNGVQRIVELCFKKEGQKYVRISPNKIEDLFKGQFNKVLASFEEAKNLNHGSFICNLYETDKKYFLEDESYLQEIENCSLVYNRNFQLYARVENLRRTFNK